MTKRKVTTREEWLAVRGELLAKEKEHTFGTDQGPQTLRELFGGRPQLMVYHFMFGPTYAAGCPVCSSAADTFNGAVPHLNARDVTFTCISRAPLDKLQAYRRRMG